jgi:alcohol dehydrogenase class IV
MEKITLYYPQKIVFGAETIQQLPVDCRNSGYQRILFVVASPLIDQITPLITILNGQKIQTGLLEYTISEPTVDYFNSQLDFARTFNPDCIVGIGGGSVLDTAKLLAALQTNIQSIQEVFGINILTGRNTALICVPTTSGTGSEVSPNAIFLDENTMEKKGIISPHLVPDTCYIDPKLTIGLPSKITAETAMDALSHCIEAYTNRHSHPVIDNYALAGIRLITENMENACKNGQDIDARSALSLGSMYGGLCLGPVNTAAVHALSYGLGGKYHVPHGLANAILLPEVMLFNVDSNIEKYKQIALSMNMPNLSMARDTALQGIERIRKIAVTCGIPQKLSDINIKPEDVDELTDLAMNVERLLVNNPKVVRREDVVKIYQNLF